MLRGLRGVDRITRRPGLRSIINEPGRSTVSPSYHEQLYSVPGGAFEARSRIESVVPQMALRDRERGATIATSDSELYRVIAWRQSAGAGRLELSSVDSDCAAKSRSRPCRPVRMSCYDPSPRFAPVRSESRAIPKQADRGGRARSQWREVGAMTNRRTWIRRASLRDGRRSAREQLWRHGHDYVFPRPVRGRRARQDLSRAWQKPWPMRRIVRDYKIRTVTGAGPSPRSRPLGPGASGSGRRTGRHAGFISRSSITAAPTTAPPKRRSPTCSIRPPPCWPTPQNYPIFFHCHHGLNRTSMVQIAYRTKYCGWTLDQAADEIDRTVGLVKVSHGPDYRHMVSFYENRVLPLRATSSSAQISYYRRPAAYGPGRSPDCQSSSMVQ